MKYNRIIAFGDVHGCYHTLVELMNQIKPTIDDLLVFCGDAIDRGLFSFETVDYIIGLKYLFPQTVIIKGNHEDMFLGAMKGDMMQARDFMYNGGGKTLDSYDKHGFSAETLNDLPPSHKEFYESMKVVHIEDDFVFVHGGLVPFAPVTDQHKWGERLTWIRDEFLWSNYDWGKTIIHGHTPMVEGEMEEYHRKYKNKINIDGGCVYGHSLDAVDVLTRTEYSVKLNPIDVGK